MSILRPEIEIQSSEGASTRCLLLPDPCGQYPNVDTSQLLDAAGFVLGWALAAKEGESMAAAIERRYPFYSGQMTGGKVTGTRAYQYPQDPPLYPFFALLNPATQEELLAYPHAIFAVRHNVADDPRPDWISHCD